MSTKEPEGPIVAWYCECCMEGIEDGEDACLFELGKSILHKVGGHAIFELEEGEMYVHEYCAEDFILKNRKIEVQKEPTRCSKCLEAISPNSSLPFCSRLVMGELEGNLDDEVAPNFTENKNKYDYYLCANCTEDSFVESPLVSEWVESINRQLTKK